MKKGAAQAKQNLVKDLLQKNEYEHLTSSAPESASARSRTPKRPQPFKQRTRELYSKLSQCEHEQESSDDDRHTEPFSLDTIVAPTKFVDKTASLKSGIVQSLFCKQKNLPRLERSC